MSKTATTNILTYPADLAIRAGEFSLLPKNPSLPLVISQPVKNFTQFTWILDFIDDTPVYQNIEIENNTIAVLQGTKFMIGTRVVDPSNVNDINDTSGLSFVWKRDGGSLYEINQLNNGLGLASFLVEDSTIELSGEYTCEITNEYGTTETSPLTVNVIDPLKHPKLYKNLIQNSDGDGGTSGWQASPDIVALPFYTDRSFYSFLLGGMAEFTYKNYYQGVELKSDVGNKDFYFSIQDHGYNFYNLLINALKNPNYTDLTTKDTALNSQLLGNNMWLLVNARSEIILNEDSQDNSKSPFAGFFPGPRWLDLYNKNTSKTIGLVRDLSDYRPTYFTRNRIRFEKFGGQRDASFSQTVDLTEAADIIDGKVYGIQYTTSQFFAYVGAGITDYKIKVQTVDDGERIFNFYVGDTEDVWNRTRGVVNVEGRDENGNAIPSTYTVTYSSDLFEEGKKIQLVPDTPIEIIPRVYDKTVVNLEYVDGSGNVLDSDIIDGPNEKDVWAIKEKTLFPMSLFGIFKFFDLNNNPHNIVIFGQKYTDTDALKDFFTDNTNYLGYVYNSPAFDFFGSTNRDPNVKFVFNKIDFTNGGTYPSPKWYTPSDSTSVEKAVNERGAAAMFAIGKTRIVPSKTRSVRVTVRFTHDSSIIADANPELKGWNLQELYSDEYGQSTGYSKRLLEYGRPRCGITKMKFLLAPNNLNASVKYTTYFIPTNPSETVLGLAKQQYGVPSAFDNTQKDRNVFVYQPILPGNPPTLPIQPDVFFSSQTQQAYNAAIETEALSLDNTSITEPEPDPTPLEPEFNIPNADSAITE